MPFYKLTRISRSVSGTQDDLPTPEQLQRDPSHFACSLFWEDGKRMDYASITDLFFKDLEAAREFIKKDSENGYYGLCECYYTYIVLEQQVFADRTHEEELEGWDWQEWYRMEPSDDTWVQIDQPGWAKGTVDFGT